MRRDTINMPLTKYNQLVLDKSVEDEVDVECFDYPFLLNAFVSMNYTENESETGSLLPRLAGRDVSTLLDDPIKLGWLKSIRVLNNVLEFILRLKHRTFHTVQEDTCIICEPEGRDRDRRNNTENSKHILYKYETQVVKSTLSKTQLEQYIEVDGILYFLGRLTKENPFRFKDLDAAPFLDTHEFAGPVPVYLIDSPIVYSLVVYIHLLRSRQILG